MNITTVDGLGDSTRHFLAMPFKDQVKYRMKRNVAYLLNRYDASEASAFALARELEHTTNDVLRDVFAPNSAEDLFVTDTSVPSGAREYTVRRISTQGEFQYHGWGANETDKAQMSVRRAERKYPVHAAVAQIKTNFFDNMTMGFAGLSYANELRGAAEQAKEDFLNTKTFEGFAPMNVLGIFNYPFLPKGAAAITFGNGATPEAILDELHRLANSNASLSETRFSPNRMILSPRLRDYLATRKLTIGGETSTILQAFLKDNPYIDMVAVAPEMKNAAGTGLDYILFDRAGDRMSIKNVVPQGLTMMPLERRGFENITDMYFLHGGVNMWAPLNNLLVTVTIGTGVPA